MTIENVKKRIDYLDAAKGIAILAVIVGHFYAPGIIGRIIHSFHLPLFFIISGYIGKRMCINGYYPWGIEIAFVSIWNWQFIIGHVFIWCFWKEFLMRCY
ncbi:MAG: hypothetical protein IK081_15615 [Lachnospiraceae bacterium]|nr:hypothetical protein [Lachnospiraceae bacterium]